MEATAEKLFNGEDRYVTAHSFMRAIGYFKIREVTPEEDSIKIVYFIEG